MFKKIRVVILLSILLFVALGEFLAARRSTDWDDTLWVDVYLVNGDRLDSTQRYIDSIDAKEFDGVDAFFATEAKRYGVAISEPFRLNLVGQYRDELPAPSSSMLGTIWWSLEMRWLALEARLAKQRPEAGHRGVRDLSRLGGFGRARSIDGAAKGTDRRDEPVRVARRARLESSRAGARAPPYARRDGQVRAARRTCRNFPKDSPNPNLTPPLPQKKAELMAGRIPLDERHAATPESLRNVVVGRLTAEEIGWLHE